MGSSWGMVIGAVEFNVWPDSLQGSRLVEERCREGGWKVSSVWRCKERSWIQRVVCEQSRRLALNWWQGLGRKVPRGLTHG